MPLVIRSVAQAPGRDGERRAAVLRDFGSRNTASSGELLAGFFRYFAYELDCRASVVRTGSPDIFLLCFVLPLLLLLLLLPMNAQVKDKIRGIANVR